MKDSFRAYRIHNTKNEHPGRIETLSLKDLSDGELVIRVQYSSVNYKDALAGTGRGRILKRFPLIGGIDACGVVETSSDKRFRKGDLVLATGCNLSEVVDGGYAEYTRLLAETAVHVPQTLTAREAMAIGTAGFTAALCLHRMETNGQTPHMGPIVVTGASGGVGMLSLPMLASRGFEVIAVSSKTTLAPALKSYGASTVVTPDELKLGSRPLEETRFGGAIDNVGGDTLAGLCRHIGLYGNIASVGLAGGAEFHSTVMPHILRGVSILGISSNNCDIHLRHKLWNRLATDLKPKNLNSMISETVHLEDLSKVFERMLDRKTYGRIVVEIN